MAAGIFDTSNQGDLQASPITIKEGIQKPIVSPVGAAVGSLANSAVEHLQAAAKRKATEKDYSPVGAFSLEISTLTDAVERGDMTPSEASTRIRAKRNRYIAENPGVNPKDFFDIQQESVSSDKVLSSGTEDFIQAQAIEKRARDTGYLMPGMDDNTRQARMSDMLAQEALSRTMEQNVKLMDYESKQVGLKSSKISLRKAELEESSRFVLQQSIGIQNRVIESKASTIIARTQLPKTNPNYLDGEQAEVALSQLRYQLQGFAAESAPFAGNDFINQQITPMMNYLSKMSDVVTGKVQKEVLDNRLNNDKRILQLQMKEADPRLAALAAFDELFKNSPVVIGQEVSEKALALHVQGSNGQNTGGVIIPQLTSAMSSRDVKDYTNILRGHAKEFKEGKLTPEAIRQLDNQHASIVKTIGESPNARIEDLLPLVNYLSGPEFRDYVKARGGVPADIADARLVLNRQYKEQLLPLLKDKFSEYTVSLQGTDVSGTGRGGEKQRTAAPLSDYVSANYKGGAVVFELVKEPKDPMTRKHIDFALKGLNADVAPHLTKLTNLGANFNNSDPRAEWEELKTRVIPAEPANPKKGTIDRTPTATGGELTPEERTATPTIDAEDVKWVRDATTLEEKKRRAERLGISLDLIEQATRGR